MTPFRSGDYRLDVLGDENEDTILRPELRAAGRGKSTYAPTNFFRVYQNVKPDPAAACTVSRPHENAREESPALRVVNVPVRLIGDPVRPAEVAGSNVTMLPFSRASTSWGRFAASVRASASGYPRHGTG